MERCKLRVSIITPSFNQGRFIEETIRSVQRQRGVDVEHIVVDGGSTDETVRILKQFPHLIWVSEPDKGQADALNKGLALASGDVVGWLNSDDYYVENILEEVVAEFANPATQWVIGNLTTVYESTSSLVAQQSPAVSRPALLRNPDIVRQQSTFFRKEVLDRVGGWNARFFMVMDFDLWVRLLRVGEPVMVNRQWAYFRMHELQKTSRRNILRQLSELTEVMVREGASSRDIALLRMRRSVEYAKASLKGVLISWGLLSRKYDARPLRLPKSTPPP